MQTGDDARGAHPQLRRMIDELRSLLTAEQLRLRPKALTAYELLCDLGEQVQLQLGDAQSGAAPRGQTPGQEHRRGFISGDTLLRQAFDDYHGRWLENCDFNFNDDFLAETHAVFDMVVQRIEDASWAPVATSLDRGKYGSARA